MYMVALGNHRLLETHRRGSDQIKTKIARGHVVFMRPRRKNRWRVDRTIGGGNDGVDKTQVRLRVVVEGGAKPENRRREAIKRWQGGRRERNDVEENTSGNEREKREKQIQIWVFRQK
ncbi:hypothetical protein EUGRSUZ_D00370 [Eucalyptus grandis]|uniref:Uncharacterized protein n=2 Tax=Eucalyptus grandis TaxID=71139 RepID=A0ACC3L2H7_EUCGR|nr:hypothetical protein EUGRSUZ_D00370 [Eucalyptus grandis]